MRIAIFGAGAIGLGLAAYWLSKGNKPVLVSLSGRGRERFGETPRLKADGRVNGEWSIAFASAADALQDAEFVIVAQQLAGHNAAVDALATFLKPGQTVLFSGALSFMSSRLATLLGERGIEVAIAGLPVPPINARMTGEREVFVSRIQPKLEFFTRADKIEAIQPLIARAFPDANFDGLAPLAGADLNNINPIAHYPNALCNFTRIENGESWKAYAGYTEHVVRLIDGVDAERQAIAAALGIGTRSLASYLGEWNGMEGASFAEISRSIIERGLSPNGPTDLGTRYVSEDVPFGLVPLETLARAQGIATPLITAGIDIFCALYATDFRSSAPDPSKYRISA